MPNGKIFELCDNKDGVYLYHKSGLGEFFFGSDAITHSYRNTKKMAHILNQIPAKKIATFFFGCGTIGSYIIFPSNRINNRMTINGARGMHNKIKDRFDLTLECIRLFYANIENPLSSVLARYADFFALFGDFKGYVDFFLLQDLVTSDYSAVTFHLQHLGFDNSPLPENADEYIKYRENTIKFFTSRGKRILKSVSLSS